MESDKPKRSSQYSAYAKYSTLAIQMALTIGLFAWLGTFLDEKYQMETPLYTVAFSLFGIFMSLYRVIKGVTKRDDS